MYWEAQGIDGPLNPCSTRMLWMDLWEVWDGSNNIRFAHSVQLPVLNTEHVKAKTVPLCSDNKCS